MATPGPWEFTETHVIKHDFPKNTGTKADNHYWLVHLYVICFAMKNIKEKNVDVMAKMSWPTVHVGLPECLLGH